MTAERERFTLENLGLAHSCARRYSGRGIEYDDLYQTACIGLIKAAENFDQSRNLRFSTYAVPVILGELKQLFRNSGSIKASRRLRELGIKARRLDEEFSMLNGRAPKISELAELLGTTQHEIAEALCAVQQPESLDTDDNRTRLSASTRFEEKSTECAALRQVLELLDDTDKAIITKRYMEERTQSETAEQLGMTQVQISRRERRLLGFIRAEMNR